MPELTSFYALSRWHNTQEPTWDAHCEAPQLGVKGSVALHWEFTAIASPVFCLQADKIDSSGRVLINTVNSGFFHSFFMIAPFALKLFLFQ